MSWGSWRSVPELYCQPEQNLPTHDVGAGSVAFGAAIRVAGSAIKNGAVLPPADLAKREEAHIAAIGAGAGVITNTNQWVFTQGLGDAGHNYHAFEFDDGGGGGVPNSTQYDAALRQVVYTFDFSNVLNKAALPGGQFAPFYFGHHEDEYDLSPSGESIDYHPDDEIVILGGAYYWVTDHEASIKGSPALASNLEICSGQDNSGSGLFPSWSTSPSLIKSVGSEAGLGSGKSLATDDQVALGGLHQLGVDPAHRGTHHELDWTATSAWNAANKTIKVRILTNHVGASAPPFSETGFGGTQQYFENHLKSNLFSGPFLKVQFPRYRIWEGIPPLRLRARDDDTATLTSGAEPAVRIMTGETGSRDRTASVQRSRRIFYGPNTYA